MVDHDKIISVETSTLGYEQSTSAVHVSVEGINQVLTVH